MVDLAEVINVARTNGPKLLKFAAVSAVSVPLGMFLLWLFLNMGIEPVTANISAVVISTIPNYLLNRYWVWNKSGKSSVTKEIAPYWAMAFLGLGISTLAVWLMSNFRDDDLAYLAANFISFGVVWIFKFFVLERFLFGEHTHDTHPNQ